MQSMIKKITALILAALFAAAFLGCSKTETPAKNTFDDIEINPGADAAKTESITATLYYANSAGSLLVGESRSISAPVNDRVEVFILEELIKGPTVSGGNFNALINPNTRIVSISDSGDVLTVVLSVAFLSWPFDTEADNASKQKKLAVYSIVNTLVEASGYPRVQILVDRDSSGAGQRIQLSELGGSSELISGEAGVLGSLARNGDIVLTPKNTLNEIMRSMTTKDFSAIYEYIAYGDSYGHKRPDETAFSASVQSAPTVEGYSIGDEIVSDDGQSAVVMMDYTVRLSEGETVTRTGVPAALLKENGVWRQKYSAFEALFEGVEAEN